MEMKYAAWEFQNDIKLRLNLGVVCLWGKINDVYQSFVHLQWSRNQL